MPREEKRVELRTIDDEALPPRPVIRLRRQDIQPEEDERPPIRLGWGADENREPSRLHIPSREQLELRTHPPGLEALIESDAANPELTEQNWGGESASRQPVAWGWFALIGLALASALIWSLSHLEKADVQADRIRSETQSVLVKEQQEETEARQLVDRLEASLRSYFSATTVDSLSRMVRHRERVTPLMLQYYSGRPVFTAPVKSVKKLQPLTLENRGNFWMGSVILANGAVRNLIIEIDPSGQPLIDWETLVCHQPMDWNAFVRQRPAGTSLDFRVYAEPDIFFSHEFADAARWRCYRLTALDSEETLFGYVPAGGGEAQTLDQLIQLNGGRKTSMILRLGIPQGLQSRRGVMIEKVISPRWLYIDPPVPSS